MENTEKPASADTPVTQPRDTWWVRFIRHAKRKMDERTAKKQKEAPTDRAARVAANATVWIAIFTFVSVAVSVGTFLILRSQLTEMHDGGVDTHTLAQQAVNQTTMLRQQVVGTFAAAIPEEPPFPRTINKDLQLLRYTGIGMSFRNVGKVNVSNFITDLTVVRQNLPNYRPMGLPEHKQTTKTQMRPYEQTGPQGFADSVSLRFNIAGTFTDADLERLQDLKETIKISGYMQYGNGFGDTVHEPLCFLYATIPQHTFTESGAGTGGGTGGWFPCEDAKNVIAQALKWKQKQ